MMDKNAVRAIVEALDALRLAVLTTSTAGLGDRRDLVEMSHLMMARARDSVERVKGGTQVIQVIPNMKAPAERTDDVFLPRPVPTVTAAPTKHDGDFEPTKLEEEAE